jgi:type II secretory pathway pseudopilin PulG
MKRQSEKGYALLLAILAVTILTILALAARSLWETEVRRDLEEELIFRAEQVVTAIKMYIKQNNNQYPENLEILAEKRYLRKLFPDPMSESGIWNIVMQPATAGSKKLFIVAPGYLAKMNNRARIIGVSSTSRAEGFRVYRGKKQYHEWAFYFGENVEEDMPVLEFIGF